MSYADTDLIPIGTVVQASVGYNFLPFSNLTDSEVQYWLGQDVTCLDGISETVEGVLTLGSLNVSGTANQDMQAGVFKAQLLKALADINAQRAIGVNNIVVASITSNVSNGLNLGGITNPFGQFSGTLSLLAVAAIVVIGFLFFEQIKGAVSA